MNKERLKGNIANLHHTHRWSKLAKRFKDANYGLCADPFGLHAERVVPCDHVHHILPLEHYPQYFYSWSNLVCLCEECHIIAHRLYAESPEAYFKAFHFSLDKLQKIVKGEVVLKTRGYQTQKRKGKKYHIWGVNSNIFEVFDDGGVKIEGGVLKI